MTGRLRSMTGHGVGQRELGAARLEIEVRSLNHRFVEVRVKLPFELAEHASAVEEQVRRALGRGRIEVTGRLLGEGGSAPVLDVARASATYRQLLALRDAIAPGEPVPLALLASVPDLFVGRGVIDAERAREALLGATEDACATLEQMRAREGLGLAEELSARAARVRAQVAAIEERVPVTLVEARRRMRERIEKLLAGSVPVDPARLAHEIALLADRTDVTEECERLRIHLGQLESLVREPAPEPLGRRLDFLLQEMAREANTIGSKSSDAEIAQRVVDVKADLERLREQVQNVL